MATAQSSEPPEIDLFLVGKTGQGKSSVGNYILGREVFQVSDDAESETFTVQVGWSRQLGWIFKIVDAPGLCDNRLKKGKAAKKVEEDMLEGIMQCPKGFHSMLYVLKYGDRFTEEDLNTLKMLKAMFGPNFVRDFCIIVFTHGELFDMNNGSTQNRTFADWCKKQKGALQTLLQESDYKAVLFYNKKPEKHEEKMQELLALVSSMKSKGVRYTSDIFTKVAATREQFIIKENAPELREEFQAKINLLEDSIEKMMLKKDSFFEAIADLKKVRQDAMALMTEITIQDKGTKVLDPQKQLVEKTLHIIDNYEEKLREKKSNDEKEIYLNSIRQELIETREELLRFRPEPDDSAETFQNVMTFGANVLLPMVSMLAQAAITDDSDSD